MNLIRKLTGLMLPSEMLDYFEIVKVKHSSTLIELSLDEVYPSFYREYPDIESKGIMTPTPI